MALTSSEHSKYGERGQDEFLIRMHFNFLHKKISEGFDLIPLIENDRDVLGCKLSERFLSEFGASNYFNF
jgi:hypothetical protein